MTDSPAWPALDEQLARWTAAGLIAPEQATRIETAEAAKTEAAEVIMTQASPTVGAGEAGEVGEVRKAGKAGEVPPVTATADPGGGAADPGSVPHAAPPHRRLPLVAEALGYVGAVIVIAAGYVAVDLRWPNLPPRAELTFAGIVGVVLLIAGSLLRTDSEPALRRLRSVLWLISTVGAATFVAVLGGEFWHLSGISSALLAEIVASLYAIALWWRSRAALQQLGTFWAMAALAGTGIAKLAPHSHIWGAGVGIWALAALWAFAEYRGYLVPRTVGYVAAGIGLLLGAQLTMGTAAGQLLAMATVAGLLAAGVALRRTLLVGFGAAGAIVLVPQTATRYLPGSAGALAVAAVGLILLGTALWLAKSRRAA